MEDSKRQNVFYRFMGAANRGMEVAFYKLGVIIGDYAIVVLVLTLLVMLGAIAGLTKVEFENDLDKLWIESDSRIVPEKEFQDARFKFFDTRQSTVLAHIDKDKQQAVGSTPYNVMRLALLRDDWLKVHKVIQEIKVAEGSELWDWEAVCARTAPTRPFVASIFAAFGLNGFPCQKISALDCFYEGQYDMNVRQWPELWGQFNVTYCRKPYLGNVTDVLTIGELKNVIKDESCKQWADVEVPENFLFGGVSREEDNNVKEVRSVQSAFFLKAPETMAQDWCVKDCCEATGLDGTTTNFCKPQEFCSNIADGDSDDCRVACEDSILLECLWDQSECPDYDRCLAEECGQKLEDGPYIFASTKPNVTQFQDGYSTSKCIDCKIWDAATYDEDDVTCDGKRPLATRPDYYYDTATSKPFNGSKSNVVDHYDAYDTMVGRWDASKDANGPYPIYYDNLDRPQLNVELQPGQCKPDAQDRRWYSDCDFCIRRTCMDYARNNDTTGRCTKCVKKREEECYSTCRQNFIDALSGVTEPQAADNRTLGNGATWPFRNCGYYWNACDKKCQDEPESIAKKQELINRFERILLQWEQNFLDAMGDLEFGTSKIKVDYFATRSRVDLVEDAANADSGLIIAGYAILLVFSSVALIRFHNNWYTLHLESMMAAATTGVFLVIIALVAAFGFSGLTGIRFSPLMTQVLPFLALGLGVNDMFILSFAFIFDKSKTPSEMMGDCLVEAGVRCSLTSGVNTIAFAIGSSVPLPAVAEFSLVAMWIVIFNYIVLVFGYSAVIALHARRVLDDRVDCFCCFKSTQKHTELSSGGPRKDPAAVWGAKLADVILNPLGSIVITSIVVAILAVAIWGCTIIEVGLPLADIVPKETYAYGFLSQREAYYDAWSSGIVTGMNSDGKFVQIEYWKPEVMDTLIQFEHEMSELPNVGPRSANVSATSWVTKFVYWFVNEVKDGRIPEEMPNAALPAVVPVSEFAGGPQWLRRSFDPELENDPDYDYLWPAVPGDCSLEPQAKAWANSATRCSYPNGGAGAAGKQFWHDTLDRFLGVPAGVSALSAFSRDENNDVAATYISFVQQKLRKTEDILDFIRDSRAITDKYSEMGIPMFPGGVVYDLYEQYLNVKAYVLPLLVGVFAGIYFVALFFIFNPLTTLYLLISIIILTVQIYGFLALYDLKLNGVCVVNLIMAVGVNVEYTAHISRVFMTTQGTNRHRAHTAVTQMAYPIIFSAVSTFLGVIPMSFAKFPYFVLYFFNMYVLIIWFGFFYGLFFYPIVLAYIGPGPIPIVFAEMQRAQDPASGYNNVATPKEKGLELDEIPSSTQ